MDHWGGLEGAKIINTRHLIGVGETIDAVIADRGIGLVLGPSAVGKSFSVDYHLGRLKQPYVRVVVADGATPRALAAEVFGQLTGDHDARGTRGRLEHEAVRMLVDGGHVLLLDECQWLRGRGFDVVRSIYERSGGIPMVFAGGPAFEDLIRRDQMLMTRVNAQEKVAPLTPEDVLEGIPNYHAIYEGAELEVIAWSNLYLNGLLRRWAVFTKHSVRICTKAGISVVDRTVATEALRRMGLL
jgi:hypothetical protein